MSTRLESSEDSIVAARARMIERNRNAWRVDRETTPATNEKPSKLIEAARQRMIERSANAWKSGGDGR